MRAWHAPKIDSIPIFTIFNAESFKQLKWYNNIAFQPFKYDQSLSRIIALLSAIVRHKGEKKTLAEYNERVHSHL